MLTSYSLLKISAQEAQIFKSICVTPLQLRCSSVVPITAAFAGANAAPLMNLREQIHVKPSLRKAQLYTDLLCKSFQSYGPPAHKMLVILALRANITAT